MLNWTMWPPVVEVLRYLGAEIPPTSRSGWVRISCFAHPDRKPSAAYNVALNGFNCMSCGLKGTALTLIMQEEGLGYREAVELAERLFGGDVADRDMPPTPRGDMGGASGRFRSLFG